MTVVIEIEEDLWCKAQRLSGIKGKKALVKACFRALIERESARRLARMAGSEPKLKAPPRRRPGMSAD